MHRGPKGIHAAFVPDTRIMAKWGEGYTQHDFMLKDECLVINYNDDVTDVQFGYSDLNAEELMKFRKFMRENPDDDDDDDDDDD